MFGVQRVVKYIAITLAVLIVCGILTALVTVGEVFNYVTGRWDGDTSEAPEWSEEVEIGEIKGEIRTLAIDLRTTSIEIKRGDRFEVRADDEVIDVRRDGETLYLEEKGLDLFHDWGNERRKMLVVIPEDELEELRLKAGAGRVDVRGIRTEVLNLELGAGKTELEGIVVTEKAKINGGAGLLVVKNGAVLNNLDLDMGVGKVELAARLTGKNEIDAGVGKLEMRLAGDEEDYQIRMDKGIGALSLNGVGMSDGSVWGKGETVVEVDGGVGAIEIEVR